MSKLFKNALIFTGGILAGMTIIGLDVDKGDVVYEDDEKYVRSSKSKGSGWSYGKIHWKKPIDEA